MNNKSVGGNQKQEIRGSFSSSKFPSANTKKPNQNSEVSAYGNGEYCFRIVEIFDITV